MRNFLFDKAIPEENIILSLQAAITGGSFLPMAVAPTIDGTGTFAGGTGSANFSAQALGALSHTTDAQGNTILQTPAFVNETVATPTAETIVGLYIKDGSANPQMYIALDRPLAVAAGKPVQISMRLQHQCSPGKALFSDQSAVSITQ